MDMNNKNGMKVPQEAESIIKSSQALRAIQGQPQKTRRLFLIAATTAILIATAACKNTSTTPTTSPTFVDTFGNLMGSFNGVNAYCNRDSNYRSNEPNYYNGVQTGYKWLCSEYVQRYYLQIYGMYIATKNDGYAQNLYYTYASQGLSSYPNGGSVAPQVGDIICSGDEMRNHVAIVREVGPNYINVIQQNWNNSSADDSQTLGRNGNRVDPFNLSYPIYGWLRMPSQAK